MSPLWSSGPGKLEEARQQAELCIEQAEDGASASRPLRLRARQALWRIYSRLADISLDAADYSEALTLLHKGFSMAIECRSTQSVHLCMTIYWIYIIKRSWESQQFHRHSQKTCSHKHITSTVKKKKGQKNRQKVVGICAVESKEISWIWHLLLTSQVSYCCCLFPQKCLFMSSENCSVHF